MSERTQGLDDDEEDRFLRTEFLERVAHELRGPAGVTLGALDELELALAEATSPRVIALLAMARRGARRVLRTAERLSRTAQLEAGSAAVTPFPLDLRGVVSRATLEASDTEGRASVEVVTDLPDEPCMAAADSAWLSVAVTEMVGQAIRSATRSVSVRVVRDGEVICINVTDDRSMKPDTVKTRFARNGTRRDTGLDMPLVHDIARMHGSPIEMQDLRANDIEGGRGVRMQMKLAATR